VRRSLVLIMVVGLALLVNMAAYAQAVKPPSGLIPPPPIYLPAGGTVVTEVNLSDNDVLGIIKQAIPAAADALKNIAAGIDQSNNPEMAWTRVVNQVDIQGLLDAVQGIKDIRAIMVRYPGGMTPRKFMSEFDSGVGKIGPFSKILSDTAFSNGAAAIYAQPDNVGYMAFAYDPNQHTAYVARVVGFVDVPKLIQWVGDVAKLVVNAQKHEVASQNTGAPVPPPAPAQPAK